MHVAGVVLNRHLHPRIARLAAAGLQDGDGVRDTRLNAAFGFAILHRAQDGAENRGTEGFCHPQSEPKVFFSGAPGPFERLRRRADAPTARVDRDAEVVGFSFHFTKPGLVEAFVRVEIGNDQRIEPQPGRVVEEGGRFPAHRAHGIVVHPESNLRG